MYKKMIAICLFVVILISFSACSSLAKHEAQVESMLTAICDEDAEAAYALMHPENGVDQETFEDGFSSLTDVLDGRKWESYRINSVKVNNKTAPEKERTEEGQYIVTLEDDTKLILEYVYVSDAEGEGFQRFSLTEND